MFPFGTVNSNPLYTNSPAFEIFALFDMLIISMVFLLFYSLKTNVITVLLITHPGTPNIYAVPTAKGYLGSIVP